MTNDTYISGRCRINKHAEQLSILRGIDGRQQLLGCGGGGAGARKGAGVATSTAKKHLVASFGGCWEDRGGTAPLETIKKINK